MIFWGVVTKFFYSLHFIIPLQRKKDLLYLDLLGLLAQLVEQRPFKAWVEGSSPS